MLKVLKYTLYDLLRSGWSWIYFGFYLLLTFSLLFLNNDVSKSVITLMNVLVVLTSLIAVVFGSMYYYNSREFIELLLGQPLKRSSIFIGQYLGVSLSLSLSLLLGLGIPFAFYGGFNTEVIPDFSMLLLAGVFQNFIFTALAYNLSLYHENRIKGFSYAILLWLFLTVLYDGLFLILLMNYSAYPLEKFSLVATLLNPVDLSRILILLQLDISALMGYTGAVFKQFFGTGLGLFTVAAFLLVWIIVPVWNLYRKGNSKDF
ncbi:MAG: ABC transporter permease [Flavobacteriaceae bacterium]|nr:ABC transporter permease [Flavobacteriaceae bacterium]